MSLYLGSEKVENVTAQITLPVEPSDDLPLADGTASAGTSKKFSRADHVHPMETVEATLVDIPSAEELGAIPAPTSGTAGQVLTKTASGQEWADVDTPQPSTVTPLAPTTPGSVGTNKAYARADHTHPSEVFIATLSGYGGHYTCDKTGAEIQAAHEAGKICILNTNVDSDPAYLLQAFEYRTVFNRTTLLGSHGEIEEYIIDYSGVVTYKLYNLWPTVRKITLTTSGWSNNQQTITCSGVSSSATSQEIRVMPADASKTSAYVSCGVSCVAQASNKLTFACDTVPTTAIDVYVVMQSLNFQS